MYLVAAYMTQAYLQVVAPSNISYTYDYAAFTKGTQITTNNAIYDGESVTSWSISPSLPQGLFFDTSTGSISGTPTVLSSQAVYTVTAENDGGSVMVELTLTVNDVAPSNLSYPGTPYAFIRNVAMSPKTPNISGGPVTGYSVSPSFPAGISLNQSTGIISGTPTSAAVATNYTVTASNSGGSATVTFSLVVSDAVPVITVPAEVYSGQKATLTLNRTSLSALPKVQNHPIFSEQAQWSKIHAVYENPNIPYGDTDRITSVRFKGASSMTGRFKAQADSGDVYVMKRIFIRDANSNRLKIDRDEFETPSALDIPVS